MKSSGHRCAHRRPAARRRTALLRLASTSPLLLALLAALLWLNPALEAGAAPAAGDDAAAESVEAAAGEAEVTADRRPAPATRVLPSAAERPAHRPFFATVADEDDLMSALAAAAPELSPVVLGRALAAARCALADGVSVDRPLLSVIDYSLPSTAERMWVFDLAARELLYNEIVAHGVGSGDNYARVFSNTDASRQTSLGLFKTAETYYGQNGYSMRLDGLEKEINHLARPRTIVVHGADYVSRDFIRRVGRLGRSWGCPALRQEVARELIDTVKDGTLLFADHPGGDWLDESPYLTACAAGSGGAVTGTAVAAR